jgi:hypothetical protein
LILLIIRQRLIAPRINLLRVLGKRLWPGRATEGQRRQQCDENERPNFDADLMLSVNLR